MKVTIQKTLNTPDPVRAHDTDAGLDLHIPAGQGCLVRRGAVYTIDLGIRVAIPDGYYGQLALRSSAGAKGLAIPHGVGIIDSGYRDNLKLSVVALTDPVLVTAGERLCQLIILPLPHVDVEAGVVDDNTDRAADRFAGLVNSGDKNTDEHTYLTVRGLMSELQEIARRCGNIPVVVHATEASHYEQATVPFVMHGRRELMPDDWDLFHVSPDGEPVVVIS